MTNQNNNESGQAADATFSFEFFPPRKQEQQRRFWRTVGCLETLQPSFFSITYGALGSASEASVEVVKDLLAESKTSVAAHLTCVGLSRNQLSEHLERMQGLGVKHIVALRGDTVAGELEHRKDGLRYASELVELIGKHGGFDVSVAAYPEVHPDAQSAQADLDNLKQKFDAGASRALTQFFYDTDNFLRFRDKAVASGINKPIIPGILPVHDIDKVIAFSARCGTVVPDDVVRQFKTRQQNPQASQRKAITHCVNMCSTLAAEGVTDFHFYTLNQSNLSHEVTRVLKGEVPAPESLVAA